MAKFIQTIKQLFRLNKQEQFIRLVGTDRFQNKFYERLPGNPYYDVARRYYEPLDYSNVRIRLDPAWEAWLRGTRKTPPTIEEVEIQQIREEQLSKKSVDMLPTSYGKYSAKGDTNSFPIRDNYEIVPGTKSREKQNPNETF